MPFDPSQPFEKVEDASGFDPSQPFDKLPDKSLSGLGQNAWEDTKGNVEGLIDLGKGMATHPLDTIKAIPGGIVSEAKRIGVPEIATAATKGLLDPLNLTEAAQTGNFEPGKPQMEALKKFGNAAYDKPVSTGLDVASLFGLGKSLMGAGEVAPAAEEAAAKAAPQVAESAAEAPNPPPVTPAAAPPTQTPPASTGFPFEKETQQAVAKAKEVKDYISKGYEGFAKKPGSVGGVADWMQEKSQMMAAQQMGATPLQARQIGHEGMRAIGQYAIDKELVSPTNGLRGMRARQTELLNNAGEGIGKYRDMADKAGGGYQPGELLQAVKAKLDQKYLRGVTEESPTPRGIHGSETGSYHKALQEIEDAGNSHSEAAKIATTLNHAANEANRLNQPHGAFTDVANVISEINNERVKNLIGSKNAALYDQSLREFGVNKKIGEMLKRKEAGEVKRFGPGSVGSNMVQKGMDEFGYRVGAKVTNKVSKVIGSNPSIAKNLPSIFKEFINQIEDVNHEVTGLSQGGLVTPEMAGFIQRRGSR